MATRLIHSPADVVRWLLVLKAEGTDPGRANQPWPAYKGKEPGVPDNCLTVYDTSPQSDGRTMVDGESVQHYGVQVRVRGTTDPVAWRKAESVATSFSQECYEDVVNVPEIDQVPSARYTVHCLARINTLPLGRDAPGSNRYLYTVNALVTLTPLG